MPFKGEKKIGKSFWLKLALTHSAPTLSMLSNYIMFIVYEDKVTSTLLQCM